MLKVYSARDSMEANLVRDVLQREGIRTTVLGEALGTARGELPVTQETLPSVWVNDEDAEQALTLVKGHIERCSTDAGATPPSNPWTCPNCDECIDPQFSHCWNCQTPRPDIDDEDG